MTKTAHWYPGHAVYMGNLGDVFSPENTPQGHTDTPKSSFFSK